MEVVIPIILFIIFIPVIILIYVAQSDRHKTLINEKIESMGGSVTNIEQGSFFTGLGPFHVVGKGRVVYKDNIYNERQKSRRLGAVRRSVRI